MISKYEHRIGYACLNNDVNPNTYKTCRLSDISESRIRELVNHNLNVLDKTLDYNIRHNNKMFRVSSSLIPFASHNSNTLNWQEEFNDVFLKLRKKIKDHDIRISCHPGQYTLINSPNNYVVNASIKDLMYHATLMELLSGDPNHKMILHVGGIYGDKESAIERFIKQYHELSPLIKKYLVIENDDRLFTLEDILRIHQSTGVPCVFDNLHHECNPSLLDLSKQELFNKIVNTWKTVDGVPKMHYSQQALGKRVGSHSETIDLSVFIRDLNEFYDFGNVDIMLEVKDKNRSFKKIEAWQSGRSVQLEKEWARYKYVVMSKSQKHYNDLRILFKDNKSVDAQSMYRIIDESLQMPENTKYSINAFDHIWGYFKHKATDKEKDGYLSKKEKYLQGTLSYKSLLSYLQKLSIKYDVEYLLDSYLF